MKHPFSLSPPSVQQFLLWCQVPFHSFIHSFSQHFLNIYNGPGPLMTLRHGNGSSNSPALKGLPVYWEILLYDQPWRMGKARVREFVQITMETKVRSWFWFGGQEGFTMLMQFKLHLESLQMAEEQEWGAFLTQGTGEQRHKAWRCMGYLVMGRRPGFRNAVTGAVLCCPVSTESPSLKYGFLEVKPGTMDYPLLNF